MDIQEMNMVRVAAVQMKVTGNPEENLERILKNIRTAKEKRVKIACFPETCLVSDHTAIVAIGAYLKKIKASCRENRIFCIFSSYSRENGGNYNTAYIIDDKGGTLHKYRKVNLWGIEKEYIRPGAGNSVVKTGFGNIGVIICFDYARPEIVSQLRRADIIFCPSFMVDYQGARDVIRSFPVMRAFENMAYFVLCDAYTKRTAGMSCITGPFRVIRRLEGREGMILADIDVKRARKLKRKFGVI